MKRKAWTGQDTTFARRQLRQLMGFRVKAHKLAKKRTISVVAKAYAVQPPQPVALIPPVVIAEDVVRMAQMYSKGAISTRTFISVVKDLLGAA